MAERLAHDIARNLRSPGPWPSVRLLCEAADKLEGLIELLAEAETARDLAEAERDHNGRAAGDASRRATRAETERDQAQELAAQRHLAYQKAITALNNLVDDEPCRLDHHGYCQEHTLDMPCSVAVAKALIAEADRD